MHKECQGRVLNTIEMMSSKTVDRKEIQVQVACPDCGDFNAKAGSADLGYAYKLTDIVLAGTAQNRGCVNPDQLVKFRKNGQPQ